MSEVDDLKESVIRELRDYEEFLADVKYFVDLVPVVQELKQETEAKILVMKKAPEDILEECAPKWRWCINQLT